MAQTYNCSTNDLNFMRNKKTKAIFSHIKNSNFNHNQKPG